MKLGDNELRYIVWRSHERLRTKGDYVDMARDAAKREELGLRRNEVVIERRSTDENPTKKEWPTSTRLDLTIYILLMVATLQK